jgi:hypothetical protein
LLTSRLIDLSADQVSQLQVGLLLLQRGMLLLCLLLLLLHCLLLLLLWKLLLGLVPLAVVLEQHLELSHEDVHCSLKAVGGQAAP